MTCPQVPHEQGLGTVHMLVLIVPPGGLKGAASLRAHLSMVWQLVPHEALYDRPAGPSGGTKPREPAAGLPLEKGLVRDARPHSRPREPKIIHKQLPCSTTRSPAGPRSGCYFKGINNLTHHKGHPLFKMLSQECVQVFIIQVKAKETQA